MERCTAGDVPAFLASLLSTAAPKQTVRIAVTCAAAYAAYKLLGLKQGC